ncbi:MAG: lipoyl synthase [Chloroflexi bacterium]|nr:lipoyl synthase [Chloroflexota bacterium]
MQAPAQPQRRLPPWLKVPMPGGPNFMQVRHLLRSAELNTVCQEAHCPNIGECWERRTATFMILGDICTRACRYCAVTSGRPRGLDLEEPERLARTVQHLGLKYCVITSVNRDDLSDGGAYIFAQCIQKVREYEPECRVEVLIPDFAGAWWALRGVTEARPDVLNHNIETVRRVFPYVRAKGRYDRSLELLARARAMAPDILTKSGMMVGLGESVDEVVDTMRDLRDVGCDLLTVGQYLRPSPRHAPVERFYRPEEFDALCEVGLEMGFRSVASGPLVRSSYHADRQAAGLAPHPRAKSLSEVPFEAPSSPGRDPR